MSDVTILAAIAIMSIRSVDIEMRWASPATEGQAMSLTPSRSKGLKRRGGSSLPGGGGDGGQLGLRRVRRRGGLGFHRLSWTVAATVHVALAVLGVRVRLLGAPPLLAVSAAAPPRLRVQLLPVVGVVTHCRRETKIQGETESTSKNRISHRLLTQPDSPS